MPATRNGEESLHVDDTRHGVAALQELRRVVFDGALVVLVQRGDRFAEATGVRL